MSGGVHRGGACDKVPGGTGTRREENGRAVITHEKGEATPAADRAKIGAGVRTRGHGERGRGTGRGSKYVGGGDGVAADVGGLHPRQPKRVIRCPGNRDAVLEPLEGR